MLKNDFKALFEKFIFHPIKRQNTFISNIALEVSKTVIYKDFLQSQLLAEIVTDFDGYVWLLFANKLSNGVF